jgi:uncharacterized Zn finger protein
MSGWYYDNYFTPTRRITVKGGIKAQSKKFGTSWWAKRWNDVLESFHIGARLTRGRSYARTGQVISIDVKKGRVAAKVQGSRKTPYSVTIELSVFTERQWKAFASALSGQALVAAKLLGGELPDDIEAIFTKAKISLFPKSHGDLKTDCSCPDWSNPCKHIAAVYYLLGEEFDRDPFLILKLRGVDRDDLAALIGEQPHSLPSERPTVKPKGNLPNRSQKNSRSKHAEETEHIASASPQKESLPSDPQKFWNPNSGDSAIQIEEMRAPAIPASLPKRLGGFPFWRAEHMLIDWLIPIYRQASSEALDLLAGNVSPLDVK